MSEEQKDRPEGAPPAGVSVVHAELGVVGKITKYWPPGAFHPPQPGTGGEHRENVAIPVWCVELESSHVFLWNPNAITPIGPKELELLGAVAAGTEALFKAAFDQAKRLGLPLTKAIELVLIAFRAQCAEIARHLPQRQAEQGWERKVVRPEAPAPPPADEPPPSGMPGD